MHILSLTIHKKIPSAGKEECCDLMLLGMPFISSMNSKRELEKYLAIADKKKISAELLLIDID